MLNAPVVKATFHFSCLVVCSAISVHLWQSFRDKLRLGLKWGHLVQFITAGLSIAIGLLFLLSQTIISLSQSIGKDDLRGRHDCIAIWMPPVLWIVSRLFVQLFFLSRISLTFEGSAFEMSELKQYSIVGLLFSLYLPTAVFLTVYFFLLSHQHRNDNDDSDDFQNDSNHNDNDDLHSIRGCTKFIYTRIQPPGTVFLCTIIFLSLDLILTVIQLRLYIRRFFLLVRGTAQLAAETRAMSMRSKRRNRSSWYRGGSSSHRRSNHDNNNNSNNNNDVTHRQSTSSRTQKSRTEGDSISVGLAYHRSGGYHHRSSQHRSQNTSSIPEEGNIDDNDEDEECIAMRDAIERVGRSSLRRASSNPTPEKKRRSRLGTLFENLTTNTRSVGGSSHVSKKNIAVVSSSKMMTSQMGGGSPKKKRLRKKKSSTVSGGSGDRRRRESGDHEGMTIIRRLSTMDVDSSGSDSDGDGSSSDSSSSSNSSSTSGGSSSTTTATAASTTDTSGISSSTAEDSSHRRSMMVSIPIHRQYSAESLIPDRSPGDRADDEIICSSRARKTSETATSEAESTSTMTNGLSSVQSPQSISTVTHTRNLSNTESKLGRAMSMSLIPSASGTVSPTVQSSSSALSSSGMGTGTAVSKPLLLTVVTTPPTSGQISSSNSPSVTVGGLTAATATASISSQRSTSSFSGGGSSSPATTSTMSPLSEMDVTGGTLHSMAVLRERLTTLIQPGPQESASLSTSSASPDSTESDKLRYGLGTTKRSSTAVESLEELDSPTPKSATSSQQRSLSLKPKSRHAVSPTVTGDDARNTSEKKTTVDSSTPLAITIGGGPGAKALSAVIPAIPEERSLVSEPPSSVESTPVAKSHLDVLPRLTPNRSETDPRSLMEAVTPVAYGTTASPEAVSSKFPMVHHHQGSDQLSNASKLSSSSKRPSKLSELGRPQSLTVNMAANKYSPSPSPIGGRPSVQTMTSSLGADSIGLDESSQQLENPPIIRGNTEPSLRALGGGAFARLDSKRSSISLLSWSRRPSWLGGNGGKSKEMMDEEREKVKRKRRELAMHRQMQRLAARNIYLVLIAMFSSLLMCVAFFTIAGELGFSLDLCVNAVCMYFCFSVSQRMFDRMCSPCFECSDRYCVPAFFSLCDTTMCECECFDIDRVCSENGSKDTLSAKIRAHSHSHRPSGTVQSVQTHSARPSV